MADYGDMFYGTLPEDTQDFRRVLAGIGRTLRDRAIAAGQRIGQSGQEAIALQNQAFADPRRPTRVTDEAALARLTDMIMGGPMGFAPMGMVSPTIAAKVLPETKILDESGSPKMLFHGTNKAYENYSESALGTKTGNPTSLLGFFFSGSPKEASRYTTDWGKEGGNVRPVYLDIKNPKRLTYKQINDISMASFDESLPVNAWKTKEGQEAIKAAGERAKKMAVNLKESLIKEGYDGAIVRIGGQDEYIAFYPHQIKSAISDPAFAGLLD